MPAGKDEGYRGPKITDAMVEAGARAIHKHAVMEARREAAAVDTDIPRMRRVFEAALKESDRSAAILLFSLAEDMMLLGLKRNLNLGVTGGWNGVTGSNGVLSTAGNRLTMLELLYWIRPVSGADLRAMKAIRNRFAHHADVESFEDAKIAGHIGSMMQEGDWLTRAFGDEAIAWRSLTQRERFLMRAFNAVTRLAIDLAIGPAAMRQRVSPSEIEGSYEDAPENLKNCTRLASEFCLHIVPPR